MIKVKVSGEVVLKDGRGTEVKWYEREFDLDDSYGEEVGILRSVIRKGMIEQDLRKSEDRFKAVRTMQVDSVEKVGGKAEAASELDKKLLEATKKGCVPDNLAAYGSDRSKIEALDRSLSRVGKKGKKSEKVGNAEVIDEGYID